MKIDAEARERLEALQQRCLQHVSDANMQKTARWLGRFLHEAATPEPTPSQTEAMEAINTAQSLAGWAPTSEVEKHFATVRRFIEQAGADWMPIESAPKDGKRILGYFPPIANAHKTYDLEVQETWWEGDRWMSIYPLHQPIRWTTLPPAPKEADHD